VSAAGCLKDDGFDNHDYGLKDTNGSPVGVGFPQALNEVNVIAIPLQTNSQTIKVPLVNLLSDVPSDQDLHITLQVNQSLLTVYNNAHPDLVPLVDTLDATPALIVTPKLELTIPKGKRNDTLSIEIPNSSLFDASMRYGIGYSISAVKESGITIAQNLKSALYAIAIKNKYHAEYEVDITLSGHPSASGHYTGDVEFTTIDANTLDAPLGVAEIFAASSRLYIRINADNSLSLSSNVVTIDQSSGVNKYDPVTQTFYFDYMYSGTRHFVGTAKRK
jgi:hypothetical protein